MGNKLKLYVVTIEHREPVLAKSEKEAEEIARRERHEIEKNFPSRVVVVPFDTARDKEFVGCWAWHNGENDALIKRDGSVEMDE